MDKVVQFAGTILTVLLYLSYQLYPFTQHYSKYCLLYKTVTGNTVEFTIQFIIIYTHVYMQKPYVAYFSRGVQPGASLLFLFQNTTFIF